MIQTLLRDRDKLRLVFVTWSGEMIRHNKKSLIRSALPIMLVAQAYPAVAADISVIEPAPVVSEEAVAAASGSR